jgi:hypothetical protein
MIFDPVSFLTYLNNNSPSAIRLSAPRGYRSSQEEWRNYQRAGGRVGAFLAHGGNAPHGPCDHNDAVIPDVATDGNAAALQAAAAVARSNSSVGAIRWEWDQGSGGKHESDVSSQAEQISWDIKLHYRE